VRQFDTVDIDMAVLLRAHYIRLIGKVAHIWKRSTRHVHISKVATRHHCEIDQLLELFYNIGEATNISPLKGIAAIARMIIGKAQVRSRSFVLCQRLSQWFRQ
jgi:hypothetical protein